MVKTSDQAFPITWLIGGLAVIMLATVLIFRNHSDSSPDAETLVTSGHILPAKLATESAGDPPSKRYATTIRRPSGPPMIELRTPDPHGRVGKVSCSTCHSVREPDFANRVPADLDQFHQNMPMNHGTIVCYSCHHPGNADALRLADGTTVEYQDVMTLCAQCHGTQARDFQHGTHGGMAGYWDLNRGPRIRNNCIDCHDPHVPEFPSMQPTFKPRDRFLTQPSEANHE